MSETEKNLEQLASEFKKATDQVKGLGEELQGKMANNEKGLEGLKAQVDEALTSMNEAKSRLDELEQKAARRGGANETAEKSLVEQLMESDSFQKFMQDPRKGNSAHLSVKATITSATTNTAGAAGALIPEHKLPGVLTPPDQALTIRDLLAKGTTQSNSITYIRETGFTNGAAYQVNEGDKKAQSDIKFDEVTLGVKTIAHYMKASRQILDDAPMLQSYINGRLIYGLKLFEDRQLLNGDGSSGALHGILPQATAFADPAKLATYTIIDQLRLAQLQALIAEYPATGYVLNPIDWTKIELEKDGMGRNIIGNPQGTAQPTLWGLPVVQTQAMNAGTFLTGAFSLGAQVFDRQASAIAIATENEDDFVRNLVTILAEERLALAVYRPEAFIKGTLAAKTK
ncbi:phage major capsid protein [Avibacterium gallinarum]|uniref:HK97 family phage major capsid protein n=1 Tax=Avibacterium gallinarum TaxID=755 RepID=A0A379B048_AVIGA|nr:phage major capsid protein [Avibacterium gallinarum]POY44091.1 phage major capsid protein [Avibacterium gallinarum]TDP29105.1 HK97 family phage major capsid protein [Avibacterium gallinarum]SUB28492.1 Predicted phage phi-C31 gp36 major capsid-like protein [Avibacterium gallinarum]